MTNLLVGVDLLRRAGRPPRLSVHLNAENVANRVHLIAKEGEFSPTQYSIPRIVSLEAKLRF